MTFFYPSIFSLILLSVIYTVIVLVLVGIHWYLVKRRKLPSRKALVRMTPLAIVVLLAPVAEELWIAWNFNRLCSKDAGIFIYEKVEVEGFYDATRDTHAGPPTKQAAEYFDKTGYRFYEMVYRNHEERKEQVVHLEKTNGNWVATVFDRPTARYHYSWPHSHSLMSHKVVKHERVVTDETTHQVLARNTSYGRDAPWFFISLDRPVMLCPRDHPLVPYGPIHKQALLPITTEMPDQ